MRNIYATLFDFPVTIDITCQEARISGANEGLRSGIQTAQALDSGRRGRAMTFPSYVANLNILRAIAKRMLDLDRESVLVFVVDPAIHTIATPSMQFDSQQSNGNTARQVGRGWITCIQMRLKRQMVWIR
jgi:hypothetical protein